MSLEPHLFHPLFSHLPIVLLGLTPFALIFDLWQHKKGQDQASTLLFRVFFYGGLAFFFLTLFLGDVALESVQSQACSIPKIFQHEQHSYYALWFYLGVLLYEPLQEKLGKIRVGLVCLVLLLIASYFLYLAGHSGAELVYEYGTGVKDFVCPK